MNITFKLQNHHTNAPSIEVNDGTSIRIIAASLTVSVIASNETDLVITTSTETINITKKRNNIYIDDISINSQSASWIAYILQELFWCGTVKAKILDLYPQGWLRILPKENQTQIQLESDNRWYNIPFSLSSGNNGS